MGVFLIPLDLPSLSNSFLLLLAGVLSLLLTRESFLAALDDFLVLFLRVLACLSLAATPLFLLLAESAAVFDFFSYFF